MTPTLTFAFLGGLGLGAFVASSLFIILIHFLVQGRANETDARNKAESATLKLMSERNALDVQKVDALKSLESSALSIISTLLLKQEEAAKK